MSGHLKRLSPNLRAAGWDVEYNREASRRLWTIQRLQSFASSGEICVTDEPTLKPAGDGESMQVDADSSKLNLDDANDGHDANPGAYSGDGEPNGDRGDDIPF